MIQKITPMFWFDSDAERAVEFYVSVFPDSRIHQVLHYSEAGFEHHGRPAGSVMTLDFELCGQRFSALNGGPLFKLSEATSLVVHCETQDEIDYYWDQLSQGGDPQCQACGWVKDRFALSWQVVPVQLAAWLGRGDAQMASRVMSEVMTMKKLDLARLQKVANTSHTT